MKLVSKVATILSLLAIFHQPFVHAAKEDTAVFYTDNESADVTDHTLCIPLQKDQTLTVASVVFGVDVECHTYSSEDCSGDPLESTPLPFKAQVDVKAQEFGSAAPNGAIKC